DGHLACLRERAERLGLGERVLFPGFLPDEALTDLIRGAELALLPYRSGTGSYALSLALACGAPVLASTLPCFADAPVARAEAAPGPLRAALQRLLAAPGERQRLQAEALAWAAAHSWPAAAALHARMYQAV